MPGKITVHRSGQAGQHDSASREMGDSTMIRLTARQWLIPLAAVFPCLAILALFPASTVLAAERQMIDGFDYADDAAAQAAWTPVENSQPVAAMKEAIAGRKGLRLPCDMTGEHRRAAWDRKVQLDLSRMDRFSFWIYVEDPSQVASYFSFYFASGDGWYGASFYADKGWQRIVLDKSQFGTEGTPAGWNTISIIRVSAWKSKEAITFMAIDDLEATATTVAVIVGNLSKDKDEWPGVQAQAQMMSKLLERIGVEAGALADTDVESGALEGRKVAIFAYSPNMSEKEAEAAEEFMASGGKVVVFYSSPARLLSALGLEFTRWQRQEFEGQFASIRFKKGVIEGLPDSANQNSWNINGVKPVGKNAQIVGEWYDAKGNATGLPALAVSSAGAFMTHILLAEDMPGKEQMMLALLGNFMPEVWPEAVRRALEENETIGEFTTLKEASAFIEKSKRRGAKKHLEATRRLLTEARSASETKQYAAALATAKRAHRELALAYCAAQSPRPNEIRAVWCHSAFGVSGMTWDQAIKALGDSGMNAVVPNMLWAGRAYCNSKVLPVDESVATKGDQIAECVAAGKKHGVQVHVWKVNWNLGNAPKEFLAKMTAEKRTQKDPKGQDIDWLCPSHPANFELERDSMLEVARNYDVDGIHFDYIRYPHSGGCYCDGCRERFQQQFGLTVAEWPKDVIEGDLRAKYLDFRRANITRLVKAVSEEAHRMKPKIKVSAAVFSDWPGCRDHVGQDWVSWIENGYLDFVCPMNYTNVPKRFESLVANQLPATGHKIPFCPGIGVTLGEWTLTADQTVEQINIARRLGADGFILFNYSPIVVTDILPGLHAGATRK